MRIYLIGFMGSGKTHTGKQLAQQLSYPFVDLDDLIEAKANMSISGIFQTYGEDYFRRLEQEALHSTLDYQQVVVSTGGGAPCFFDNMKWMNEHGLSIYLDTPPNILALRLLPERAHRPLLRAYNEETLSGFIQDKLAERAYFYQQAQIVYHQNQLAGEVAVHLCKTIDDRCADE